MNPCGKFLVILLLCLAIFLPNQTRAAAKTKVVSLAPSNTELIYSLGAEDALIGVSTFCDFPAAVKKLPAAGSFVSANLERLVRLKPDVIVLVKGQESLGAFLKHNGFKVIVFSNDKPDEIATNLLALGELTGRSERAKALARVFRDSLHELSALIAKQPSKPRVFFCVWPNPLLTVGANSFLNELITACGGINIANSTNKSYPNFNIEKLVIANPDVIILPHESGGKSFVAKPPWSTLKAVKNNRYYLLPDSNSDRLSRPTLRIIDGLYWLAIRLHPELSGELDRWRSNSNSKISQTSGR